MNTSAPPLHRSAAPPMDPRIKARRIEVRRHEGRRRLQRLAELGIVLLVVAGFAAALRSPLLDVDQIAVRGAERTGAEAVVAALGIERGDQLIDVNLSRAGADVAALPWVSEVTLHRSVDGTIEVAVREREPVALVQAGGVELLVDADGRVLGPADRRPADSSPLVRIRGIEGPLQPGAHVDEELAGALAMAAALRTAVPGVVSELGGGAGDLRATLSAGGEALFGDAGRLDAKVRSLATMVEQVDLGCLDELDLRLPGSPVLTREDSCS